MSARFLVLAFLVAAPAAFAAGHWQGEHAPVQEDLAMPRVNAPIITRPGTGAADAVRYLAGARTPDPVVATGPAVASPTRVSTPPPPPPPPPEDIAIQFRRDVTAVLTTGEPHIVLTGGRRIGVGEVYQDGWRLRDISSQRAVLTKGRDTRNIDLFSPPPAQPVQIASAAPVLTGPVSFSNGLLPDQRAGQASRLPVQSQQMQQMQLLQQFLAGRNGQQQGGRGGNNGGGRGGGGGAGPNGGFGGGGGGGFGGGRRGQ